MIRTAQTSKDKLGKRAEFGSSADVSPAHVVVPLVEESFAVGTRVIETGKVRVRTLVDTEDYNFDELLDRSNIEVEEVIIGREVDFVPEPRTEGDVTIIPVVEEVLVVRRQLMLVKEVRVRRVLSTERVQQTFSARKMRAVVEREPTAKPQKEEP